MEDKLTDVSEHILLVNELNSDLHAGSDSDNLLRKACDRLARIHDLNFIDSYFLFKDDDGKRFLKFSYSSLERRLLSKIEKITGIGIQSFEIPIFEGSIYQEIHDGLQPVEFNGKESIVRVLEDMVLPEKKLIRKLAPTVVRLVGSKYIYVIPLVSQNESMGQIGFNSDKPFDSMTREALNMVVSKIADIIALKRNIKQIEEKNRELSIINRTKDKLFSIISHDLKSPFNSILGYLALIDVKSAELNKEEILSMVKLIDGSASHVFELMDNLLNWSLQQRDEIRVEKRMHNLFEIVNDTVEKQEKFGASKKITLINSVDKDVDILADFEMLKLVLRNLVSNAYKFTPGGGRIEISAKEKKNSIEVSVRDNGVGITDDTVRELFHTGNYRSTRGTENETGTGLGLELCRDIVQAHNGDIRVKSKVGKGSEFIIRIPQVD